MRYTTELYLSTSCQWRIMTNKLKMVLSNFWTVFPPPAHSMEAKTTAIDLSPRCLRNLSPLKVNPFQIKALRHKLHRLITLVGINYRPSVLIGSRERINKTDSLHPDQVYNCERTSIGDGNEPCAFGGPLEAFTWFPRRTGGSEERYLLPCRGYGNTSLTGIGETNRFFFSSVSDRPAACVGSVRRWRMAFSFDVIGLTW